MFSFEVSEPAMLRLCGAQRVAAPGISCLQSVGIRYLGAGVWQRAFLLVMKCAPVRASATANDLRTAWTSQSVFDVFSLVVIIDK